MNDITDTEAAALVAILSLAENHPMWRNSGEAFADFRAEQYQNIKTVRALCKRLGIVTPHAVMMAAAERQIGKLPDDPSSR